MKIFVNALKIFIIISLFHSMQSFAIEDRILAIIDNDLIITASEIDTTIDVLRCINPILKKSLTDEEKMIMKISLMKELINFYILNKHMTEISKNDKMQEYQLLRIQKELKLNSTAQKNTIAQSIKKCNIDVSADLAQEIIFKQTYNQILQSIIVNQHKLNITEQDRQAACNTHHIQQCTNEIGNLLFKTEFISNMLKELRKIYYIDIKNKY